MPIDTFADVPKLNRLSYCVFHWAAAESDGPAMALAGSTKTWTYGENANGVNVHAKALLAPGVLPGDRIALAVVLLLLPFLKNRCAIMLSRIPHLIISLGKFRRPNVKLYTIGKLTEALNCVSVGKRFTFGPLVGSIFGSSFSMAPGTNTSKMYEFADIDGSLLQAVDENRTITDQNGILVLPTPQLLGAIMKVSLGLALIAFTGSIESYTSVANAAPVPPRIAQQLKNELSEHKAATPIIAGEALTVWTPDWKWSGAVGSVSGTKTPLTLQHAFRIASVTKSFTAAAILRLMETRKLDITKPISGYISDDSSALLIAGGYDPAEITIQQLLSHTSGIYDYAMDEKFSAKVFRDPSHQWTRVEQIKHAMDSGKPVGNPGEIYSYSDTGYILLGEIIERKTGQNLATAVRTLLRFQKLGLVDTYWEQMERKPQLSKAPFAGNMFGAMDLTKANHSFDLFGGGGMISTTQDLTIFFRALIRGEVFDNRRTLAVLLTIPPAKRGQGGHDTYGNGVYQFNVGREHCMGHGGFWGQAVAYCPASDITFAWTTNQGGEISKKVDFLNRLAAVIQK